MLHVQGDRLLSYSKIMVVKLLREAQQNMQQAR